MQCTQCKSTHFMAYDPSNLDYTLNYLEGKFVYTNPRINHYYFNSRYGFHGLCHNCKNHFPIKDFPKKVYSPAINHKEIVLDLDHTLFFCNYGVSEEEKINHFDFEFKDPENKLFYQAVCRPHLDFFINECIKRFEKINFFTAASDWYAKILIDSLNIPAHKIGFIKTRKDTVNARPLSFDWELMKRVSNCLIVDDKPLVIDGFNNTIFKVDAYYAYSENKNDNELLNIVSYFNKKEKEIICPKKLSGEIELFLKEIKIKFKNITFEQLEEILKTPPLSQEELDKSLIRTSFGHNKYEINQKVYISIIDMNFENFQKICKIIGHKNKISKDKFDNILKEKYNKRKINNNF